MGYTTYFDGAFNFNKPVDKGLRNYINTFSSVRHMGRDTNIIKAIDPEWKEHCFKGELGSEGEYYVGGESYFACRNNSSVTNYNTPPKTQPGLWCQWVVNDYDDVLEWDRCDKFYEYVEWLQYLIDNFIKPGGYALNGEVTWKGEDDNDLGKIIVEDNSVTVKYGHIVYE